MRQFLPLFSLLLTVSLFACTGKSDPVPVQNQIGQVAGSFDSPLRWNEFDSDFPMPDKRSWLDSDSADTASYYPHHQGNDLFLKVGENASVEGRFHYGDLRLDLGGEEVGLWYREVGDAVWTYWMDGVTDNDGNVSFPLPAEVTGTSGRWFMKMVVYGDLTTSDSFVRVVDGTVPAAVFDIDGTLTVSNDEMIEEILSDLLDIHYVPRMYDDANKFAVQLAKEGVEIFYITARPYWLKRASRRWLELKGFPVGQVYTYSGAFPAMDTTSVEYKSGVLSSAIERGADFIHAFGNADTDIAAYAEVGIPVSDTYVIGEFAGLGGTVALSQYSDLYGSLVPAPPSTPRVVLMIVDGLRPDVFRYYIDEIAGPDSAFRSIFEKKVDVSNSSTCFPSMTFPGHAMIATGVSSGKNGIVGNKFLDRKTGTPYALSGGETMELSQAFSVYRGEGLANSLLETQTFYEQMSASGHYGVVANHMYFQGAEYLYPSMTEMLTFLFDVRAYDQSVTDSLLERLDGLDIPDVMTLYYGGLDTEAHELGMVGAMRPENSQIQYLSEVLDGEMNLIRNRFEALGILDEVSFVLVSDHGMVDLVGDEAHAINLDRVVNVIESSPYEDVYNQIAFEGDFDSHAGLNGGGFFITLRNRATNSWQDAPRFEEDLMPVLGAVQKQRWDGELVGAVEDILGRKSLESPYEVYRPTQVKISFEKIHVLEDNNSNGPGLFTFSMGANGKKPFTLGPVLVESGSSVNVNQTMQVDLLGEMSLRLIVSCDKGMGAGEGLLFEKSSMPAGSWFVTSSTGNYSLELSVEEVATSTSSYPALPSWGNSCPLEVLNPIYVDGPERVTALTHPTRTGDLIVLIRFGDGFYAAQEEYSGHGSMYPGDSIQAFFIGGGAVLQSSNVEGKSGADIPATICSMLGIELRDAEGVSRFPLSGN